jgi:hypothetical protein
MTSSALQTFDALDQVQEQCFSSGAWQMGMNALIYPDSFQQGREQRKGEKS